MEVILRDPLQSPFQEMGVRTGKPGVGAWTPAQWFLASEQGVWYDSSDFSAMFQNATGTTPVTAVEQPVGLVLDKRLGLVEGPELVTNGTFDTDTAGWSGALNATISAVGGRLRVTATGTPSLAQYSFPTVVGRAYRIRANYVPGTVATPMFRAGSTVLGTEYFSLVGASVTGYIERIFIATGTTAYVCAGSSSVTAGQYADFDSISAKHLPGNHASQTTAAARSVLKKSGAYYYQQSDGVDDSAATTTGGGATTSAVIVMGFRTDAIGAAQTLFSDRSGNTGLKLEITAGGNIAFSGGNGASINTATGAAVAANTDYVVTAYYDGTNLSVQLNNGTATTAACALSAGTAAITFGKDNGAASGFRNGREYQTIYLKNVTKSAGEIASAKSYVAAKCGVTL